MPGAAGQQVFKSLRQCQSAVNLFSINLTTQCQSNHVQRPARPTVACYNAAYAQDMHIAAGLAEIQLTANKRFRAHEILPASN